MNKFLRYSFVALLTMMGFGAAMAGTIVFGELGLENSVQYTEPFDGGDFTVTFAGGQNDGKYYTAGAGIRVYGNGTMTVAAKSGTLKKITVTFATGDSYRPADNNVVNTGTFDAATGVWTGDAASVVFTRPSGNGHWRVAAVSTDDSEDPGTDPNPEPGDDTLTGKGTLESPYTVADAIIVTGKLDNGQTSTDDYYIKGKISSIKYTFDVEHGTATFNISDTGAAENEFTCYGVYYLDNRAWAEGDTQVAVGDEVIIYGKVTNDNGTLETASKKAYIYSLNGVSTGINEVKTAAQTAGNVYNLAGQKVGAGFKGIVIVNGKKMIQK